MNGEHCIIEAIFLTGWRHLGIGRTNLSQVIRDYSCRKRLNRPASTLTSIWGCSIGSIVCAWWLAALSPTGWKTRDRGKLFCGAMTSSPSSLLLRRFWFSIKKIEQRKRNHTFVWQTRSAILMHHSVNYRRSYFLSFFCRVCFSLDHSAYLLLSVNRNTSKFIRFLVIIVVIIVYYAKKFANTCYFCAHKDRCEEKTAW